MSADTSTTKSPILSDAAIEKRIIKFNHTLSQLESDNKMMKDIREFRKKACILGRAVFLPFYGLGAASAYINTKSIKRQKKRLDAVLTPEGKKVLEEIAAAQGKEARANIMAVEAKKGMVEEKKVQEKEAEDKEDQVTLVSEEKDGRDASEGK